LNGLLVHFIINESLCRGLVRKGIKYSKVHFIRTVYHTPDVPNTPDVPSTTEAHTHCLAWQIMYGAIFMILCRRCKYEWNG